MNKGPERIWELLAKKMLGSATTEELEELQKLIRQYPDQVEVIRIIESFLNTKEEEDLAIDYTEQLNRIWEKVGDVTTSSPAPSLTSTQKT